jgi:ribosomal protein L37AE/L43A
MSDQISKQANKTKKVYKPKMWTCEACNYTCIITNKTNHLRTDKHNNNNNNNEIKNISIMKDQISKKVYKPKMWTCEECNYTCTNKNKTNHERTNKHNNNNEIKKIRNIPIRKKLDDDDDDELIDNSNDSNYDVKDIYEFANDYYGLQGYSNVPNDDDDDDDDELIG